MAIIITNYSEKYRDDVRNICLDTAGSNAREEKSMRFLLATFCDYYIDREAEHCFIAVDEDTDSAVGYIFCAPDYQKYKPGYQHCGIGTRLFAALTEHLREIGCKGVMLVVDSYNTNAINFYKKNKFDIIFPLRVCTVMARRV